MKQHFKGAIFDLDGTVLDSTDVWTEVDKIYFRSHGLVLPPDYAHVIKSMNINEAADYTKARFALPESPAEIISEWLSLAKERYAHEVALKPFAREYLEKLYREGIRLAVATSNRRELFLPALERNGVSGLFTAVVSSDDVARGKKFPDIYLEAAKRLELEESDCVVFEDVLSAVKCARDAGFYTVAVHDAASAHEQADLIEHSDFYVHSFKELL